MRRIKLSSSALNRLRAGHLWMYQSEVENRREELNGELVRVESSKGDFIGWGFYSHHSKIALRMLSFDAQVPEREFFRQRILRAKKQRGKFDEKNSAFRLVNAEGDFFPGLIVDFYAGQLVIQCLIPGTDKIKEMLADIFWEEIKPKGIWFRNDARTRELEALPLEVYFWRGEKKNPVEIKEGNKWFLVDLEKGHKTGLYLDQSQNRLRAKIWTKSRCLDLFSYQGGFALHLAEQAQEVIAVESSQAGIEILKQNVRRNQVKNLKIIRANVFEFLNEENRRFDLIILDPPPFARSKKDLTNARKGYLELNRKAIQLLNPGGILLSYSCSYHFQFSDFFHTLARALAEAERYGLVKEIHTQGSDHPYLFNLPETWYLKGFVVEVD